MLYNIIFKQIKTTHLGLFISQCSFPLFLYLYCFDEFADDGKFVTKWVTICNFIKIKQIPSFHVLEIGSISSISWYCFKLCTQKCAKLQLFFDLCKFLGYKVYVAAKMPQKKSASADLSVILIYSLFLSTRKKGTSYSLIICSFHLTTSLLACSFLCIKRNKSH